MSLRRQAFDGPRREEVQVGLSNANLSMKGDNCNNKNHQLKPNLLKSRHEERFRTFKVSAGVYQLGTIHKGRLLKGVGRWVHQKEIY